MSTDDRASRDALLTRQGGWRNYTAYKCLNWFYLHAYWLYRPVYGLYKKLETRRIRACLPRWLPEGGVALDVGANIGAFTPYLAQRVGKDGRVMVFEPDRDNFRRLRRHLQGYPQVTAVQAAVGDTTGEMALYVNDRLNVDHRTYDTGEGRERVNVRSVRLDDHVEASTRVDFIKMDIQGGEGQALQGMRDTLARNPDLVVLMEYWPHGLRVAGTDPDAFVADLRELGFQLFLVEDDQGRRFIPLDDAAVLAKPHLYYELLLTRHPERHLPPGKGDA